MKANNTSITACLLALGSFLSALSPRPSIAASANWTGAGTDALWSNTANWSATPVPGSADTATFNALAGAGGKIIDLGTGVSVNSLAFVGPNCDAYTIGADTINSQSLTLTASGNGGIAAGSGTFTQQITINAAITITNSQQWLPVAGANPYIINGNLTPSGASGVTHTLRINGRSFIFNGVLSDMTGGAKLAMGSGNGNTATLTNPANSFTGGIVLPNGTVSVNSIKMTGTPSAAGAGGVISFGDGFGGGGLIYTGPGDTTDRVLDLTTPLFHTSTITQSGTGLLKFTADMTTTGVSGKTLTIRGSGTGAGEIAGRIPDSPSSSTTTTAAGGAAAGATSVILTDRRVAAVGSYVTGTGIAAGTYVIANTVTTGNSGTITLSAPVVAPGVGNSQSLTFSGVNSVSKLDSGTWTLSGANTYSGTTSIGGGTLRVGSLNNIASPAASSHLGRPVDAFNGTIAIGNTTTAGVLAYTGTGETTDRVIQLAGTTGGATLDQSGTGLLKFTSNVAAPGAAATDRRKTLTLQGSSAGTGEIAGVIPDSTLGTAGQLTTSVTKTGSGTWTLSGVNTYSGTTTVSGGTLRLDASTGSLSSTPLSLSGGRFLFDNTGASTAKTQNVGTFTPGIGGSTLQITRGAAQTATVTCSALGTRAAGGTINFVYNNTAGGTPVIGTDYAINLTGVAQGFINAGSFVNGADYAFMNASGTFVRVPVYGSDSGFVTGASLTASAHNSLTGSLTSQANVTVTTLKIGGGSSIDIQMAANGVLTTAGVLVTGGSTLNLTEGTGTSGIQSTTNNELIVRTDTAADSALLGPVLAGSTSRLTKTGAGTLTLKSTNVYVGATTVNQGTLLVNGSTASDSTVTVMIGGTLGGSGTVNGTFTVQSGGTIQPSISGAANTLTLANATATLNAGSVMKIRAPAATTDKISLTTATALNITGVDLVIDTSGLIGNVPSTAIVQLGGASPVITGPFRSVTVIGNTNYTAALDYSTAGQVKMTLTNTMASPSGYLVQVGTSSSASTAAGSGVSLTISALGPTGSVLTGYNSDMPLSFYGLAASPSSAAPVITDKNGTARAVSVAAGTPNATLTFVNGVATTSGGSNGVLTAFKAATATLHCSDGIASSATGTGSAGLGLTVTPLAVASYTVTAASPQASGSTFTTSVAAFDTYGNAVTTDSSTVVTMTSNGSAQFDSNGDSTFGDNTKTLTNGAFTINTRDSVLENVTLTATSGGGATGSSTPIVIGASSAKDILTFTFPGIGAATITGTSIAMTVPFGTAVTSLAPTYTMSGGATGSPVSGTARDFTSPQTYTITAMDSSTKVYTVTVTVAPQPTVFTWAAATAGNWSTPASWTNNLSDGTAPLATGYANYTLNFTPAGTYTATHDLNNGFLLNQANFAGAVTLSGTSGMTFTNNGATLPVLNQNSASTVNIGVPVSLAADLTIGGTGSGRINMNAAFSGTGRLTKNSNHRVDLFVANTHSGGTVVNAGTLQMGNTANTLLGSGTVTVNTGATLGLNGNNNLTTTFEFNSATVINGNSFPANLNGPITLTGSNTFDLSTTGNMSINGILSGTGGLVKKGTGNGSLTITGSNSFSGAVSIQAGSITVASLNSVSGGTATSQLGAPTTVPNGTIAIGPTTSTATLIYTGNGETTDRVIQLAGTTGGATITQGGNANLATTRGQSGLLKFTSNVSAPGTAAVDNRKTLTLTHRTNASNGASSGQGEISGSIGDSLLGNAGQTATSLVKAGSGTWILSGVNTYTGSTAVQAGTLVIKRPEALGSGPLDITAGAKLQLDYLGTRQVASLNGSSTPSGTYGSSASLATYKDDTRFSGPGTITLGAPSASPSVALVLSSGSTPSNGGAALTFTATVTGSTPTGLVYFYDGLTQIGAGALNGSSQASFTTTLLTAGSHIITAVYPGDGSNAPAVSSSLTQVVNEARAATSTTLALSSGANPCAFGAAVAFTATVTGTSPTGSVAFYDGTTLLGTRPLNGSAQATLSTNGLAAGWRSITASYLGDAANAPGTTANALFQTVSPPAGNGKLKVFILAGQSNMQGKGRVEVGRDPNNFSNTTFAGGLGSLRNMLNRNPKKYGYLADSSPLANTSGTTVPGWRTLPNVWVSYFTSGATASATQARKGFLDADFGDGSSGGRIGPEYGFGLVMGSQLGDPVLIIKTAWGGNSLAWNFRPPSSGTTTLTNINTMRDAYNFMVADVRYILNNLSTEVTGLSYNPANGYEIAGFGWHQGWNDRISAAATAEYEANLTNLINDLRAEFGVPNLPVVIGTTSMANVDGDSLGQQLVAAQKAVANPTQHPEFAGTVATIDTKAYDFGTDLSPSSEGFHWNWNAESYFNIGEQMGQAMVGLLTSQSSAKDVLTFTIPGQVSSTISGTSISVLMPAGTDVTALAPTFTLSTQAAAMPVSGTARDFTAPQTYTITAQNLSTKTYTVTVSVSPSIYNDWSLNPALGLTAGVNDGLNADPDGDGLVNLLEWAFGLHPSVATSGALIVSGGVVTQRGKPDVWVQNVPNNVDFRAMFSRRKNHVAAGLTYSVQFSPDLVTWQTSTTTPTVIADDGEMEAVTVPYPLFIAGKKARFFRVSVGVTP